MSTNVSDESVGSKFGIHGTQMTHKMSSGEKNNKSKTTELSRKLGNFGSVWESNPEPMQFEMNTHLHDLVNVLYGLGNVLETGSETLRE